ncbi:MAG: phosphotransferase [Actinomycetes bacterium]
MNPIPLEPVDLTPDACTALVDERHPGVRITEVSIDDVSEVTNRHVRIGWRSDPVGALPDRAFVKMVPSDPARRVQIARTAMGPREVRFYRDLAPDLALRTPVVYGAATADDGSFVIAMEDLTATGCTVPDGTVGIGVDAAARALEELADLHARFADDARRRAVADWIPRNTKASPYGVTLLGEALAHHRDRLSPAFATIAEWYVERCDDLQALWQAGPLTVVHGDPHLGNLFDDHGRTGFLDWGIVHQGPALRDVGYFLAMALDPAVRRAHEPDLLRHHLETYRAAGGDPPPFAQTWTRYRIQAAYTVVACCQIVTFPEGISESRRRFSEAFLARAEAAIADLDSVGALRDAGF